MPLRQRLAPFSFAPSVTLVLNERTSRAVNRDVAFGAVPGGTQGTRLSGNAIAN